MRRNIFFIVFGLVLSGCALFETTKLEKPIVTSNLEGTCFFIESKRISNTYFNDAGFILDAQQQAPSRASHMTMTSEDSIGVSVRVGTAKYFQCFSSYQEMMSYLRQLSLLEIQNACKADRNVCLYSLRDAVKRSDFGNMIYLNRILCALEDKESCKWTASFKKWTDNLKSDCLKKVGSSCLTAAVMADFDNNNILMATYLKQGCSYNHSESCFYYNLELEMREAIKNAKADRERVSERAYREYVIATQHQYSRQINDLISAIQQQKK